MSELPEMLGGFLAPHARRPKGGNLRRCPKCNMKLWPVGKVLPIRFHDTRHIYELFDMSPEGRIVRDSS